MQKVELKNPGVRLKQGGDMLLPLVKTCKRPKWSGIPRALVRKIFIKGTCIVLCPFSPILLVVYRDIFVSLSGSYLRILGHACSTHLTRDFLSLFYDSASGHMMLRS